MYKRSTAEQQAIDEYKVATLAYIKACHGETTWTDINNHFKATGNRAYWLEKACCDLVQENKVRREYDNETTKTLEIVYLLCEA